MLLHLRDLVLIDAERTAVMLKERLKTNSELQNVISTLEADQEALYLLLNALLQRSKVKQSLISSSLDTSTEFEILKEPRIHEKLLDLMCVYKPEEVPDFLSSSTFYRTDVALRVSRSPWNGLL